MGLAVCVGDAAAHLLHRWSLRKKRQHDWIGICGLKLQLTPINGIPIQTGWCTRFQSAKYSAQRFHLLRQHISRFFSHAAGRNSFIADVYDAPHESPGRQNNRMGKNF